MYFVLVLARFLIAIGSHGISINSYLLAMECIGRSKKKYCSLIFEFIFSIGQLVLVLAAYFLREWQTLTFIILVPCLPFLLFILLSNESIQYLVRKKKFDQVEKILTSISISNKTQKDESIWKTFLNREKEKCDRKRSSSQLNLIKPPRFYLTLIISLNWFV